MKRIDWEGRGLSIDGLSHLISPDDINLLAKTSEEVNSMLTGNDTMSKPVGLNVHLRKTKVLFIDHVNKSAIAVDGKIIEEVDRFVYLRKTLTRDGDLLRQIRRRIALAWEAFGEVGNIMRNRNASKKIKRKIHHEYILLLITYGCETWALNNVMTEKLAVAQ